MWGSGTPRPLSGPQGASLEHRGPQGQPLPQPRPCTGQGVPPTQTPRGPSSSPSKANEAFPPGWRPQPAFGGPGISGELASHLGTHLTAPATALITGAGPAGQRPAHSPWCQINDQAEGCGGPRYKLSPPKSLREPTSDPAAGVGTRVLAGLLLLDQKRPADGSPCGGLGAVQGTGCPPEVAGRVVPLRAVLA